MLWPVQPVKVLTPQSSNTESLAPPHRYQPGRTIGTTGVQMHWPVLPVRRRYNRWGSKTCSPNGILQGTCRWIGWVQYLVCASEKCDSTLSFQSQPRLHTQKPESPTTSEIQACNPFFGRLFSGRGIHLQHGVVVEDLHAIMCANTKLFTKYHAHN